MRAVLELAAVAMAGVLAVSLGSWTADKLLRLRYRIEHNWVRWAAGSGAGVIVTAMAVVAIALAAGVVWLRLSGDFYCETPACRYE